MNTRSQMIALAALLSTALSFPICVFAEGPGPGMHEHGLRCIDGERPSAAHRLDQLHDALKLTSAQEGAWKAYREADSGRLEKRAGLRPEAFKELSAPERIEKRLAALRQQQEELTAALADTKSFYAQLTPEQQKIFDRESFPHHPLRGGEGRELPPPPPEAP